MRTIHREHHHHGWDRDLPPVMHVAPGEALELECIDASGGQLGPGAGADDVARLDFSRINPVTGPIHVDGAEPGDALTIELVDFATSGRGWTAIIPGFGLLADDFPRAFLHHSVYDERSIAFTPEIRIPTRPFAGTIGLALADPGLHSVVPPRRVGGNLDVRDLVRGTTLILPVEVPGALLSIGDPHAAQGDGEVCGTAVETSATVGIRVGLRRGGAPAFPRMSVTRPDGAERGAAGFAVTMGVGPDLRLAAADAVRGMIDLLGSEYRLDPELAYCLCSVAVDLRISEVVDVPHWTVSAYLPRAIFV